jgi:hypothetical protein
MWIMSALEGCSARLVRGAVASAFRPACEAANASRFNIGIGLIAGDLLVRRDRRVPVSSRHRRLPGSGQLLRPPQIPDLRRAFSVSAAGSPTPRAAFFRKLQFARPGHQLSANGLTVA